MNLVHRPLNKGNIIFVCLLALIPSVIITSYSVTELSVSRDSYSTDKYILFEDRDGVDQFWVDGDGFVFANGTLLSGGGGTMEQLTNVTNFGCADGQNLQVNSSGIWACATPSAGGGFSTVYKTADETINNDAVLTDDADMQFSADANGIYFVIVYFFFNAHSTPDLQTDISIPSGASVLGTNSGTDFGFIDRSTQTGMARSYTGSNTDETVAWYGKVTTDTTPGTVAFQWAQVTDSVFDTTLLKGSTMMYKKLN